jgi:phospholipase/carboxylesterase
MGDDMDSPNLDAMLAHIRSRWNVDGTKLLLTGMSDGGTFSYVTGLRDESPFTHLAPMSTAFHPMLGEMASAHRLDGLPVYVVHGALDWMFPSKMAELAAETLDAKGAEVKLEIIPDLSHTYPREVNARVLDWFLA